MTILETLTPAFALRLRQIYGYEKEIAFLPFIVPRSRAAVDVGANHGLYAAALATLVPRCIAVEPNAYLANQLVRSLPKNCEVHQLALSNKHGEALLRIPTIDGRENCDRATLASANLLGHSEERSVPVSLVTLDSLVNDLRVGFIKIDVEGYEEEVLQGGAQTLQRDKPNLLIEIEERHCPGAIQRVRALLEGFGYKMMFIEGGVLKPISQFDVLTHQDTMNEDKRDKYINNFIFLA